jgi:Ribonuclease HepT-like
LVANDDDILRNAVLRQLMVVGEAASCLSSEIRDRLPEVPWQEIRGFRNHAVHAYFSLDWSIVWEVAQVNLPDLGDELWRSYVLIFQMSQRRLVTIPYPGVQRAAQSTSNSDNRAVNRGR